MNNLQGLICQKIQLTNQPFFIRFFFFVQEWDIANKNELLFNIVSEYIYIYIYMMIMHRIDALKPIFSDVPGFIWDFGQLLNNLHPHLWHLSAY